MTETKGTQPAASPHVFSAQNVCIRCGRPNPTTESCITVPEIRPLDGPLEIVPLEGENVGAILVPADDRSRYVAIWRPVDGHFDPDAAFRALDDYRSRAQTVLQWVADSLAGEPAVPERKKLSLRPWLPMIAASVAVAVVSLLIPAAPLVAGMQWVFYAIVACTVIWGMISGSKGGCVGFWLIACVLMVISNAAEQNGFSAGLSRFVLVAIGVIIAHLFLSPYDATDPSQSDVPTGPTAYVLHEGEAVRHEPRLCMIGKQYVLGVVIHCVNINGLVLRQVVLPVSGATRADAEKLARMALAPDQRFAARRIEEEADAEVAAAARQRIAELERSRRSLPE